MKRRTTDISTTDPDWVDAGLVFAARATARGRSIADSVAAVAATKGPSYLPEPMFLAYDEWLEAVRATVPEEERP
jgi:hypothetical protein